MVSENPRTTVLVLCYHAVSEHWPSELAVTPGRLQRQLQLLVRRGYAGATFSAALAAPSSRRTVVVTFDDGYRSTLTLAQPVLAALGLPGSVFVPTDFAGRPGPMSWPGVDHWLGGPHEEELHCLDWDDLSWLSGRGWEVGSHTRSHPRLPDLDDESVMSELAGSRAAIEDALGEPCRALAYPYGAADARVVECARAAGYSAAALLDSEPALPEPLAWPRIGIYRGDPAWRYRAKLSPRLRRMARALRRDAR
jgi:peptidoglycan/xylan/chitin deacetylase (PgdA/CDA1 family)